MRLLLLLPACLLLACEGAGPTGDCPDGSAPVVATADSCTDVYCGDEFVELGVGADEHVTVEDGATVDVVRGPQGGYHLWMSVRVENFCPVTFLWPRGVVLTDGEGEEFFLQRRHVQMVRDDVEAPDQYIPGFQVIVPCEWWPDDVQSELSCGELQSSRGHIEDFAVRLEVEAEDHNDPPRSGSDAVEVQPVCCSVQ
jgi:hypothetical protein